MGQKSWGLNHVFSLYFLLTNTSGIGVFLMGVEWRWDRKSGGIVVDRRGGIVVKYR